jgi:hypothetical protein
MSTNASAIPARAPRSQAIAPAAAPAVSSTVKSFGRGGVASAPQATSANDNVASARSSVVSGVAPLSAPSPNLDTSAGAAGLGLTTGNSSIPSTMDPHNPLKPAFEAVEYYLKRAPNAQYVSLQGFDLTDLVPVMAQLARLREMLTLNLAHNALWRLPEDMSSLARLETLDLSRNRFATASLVLKGLYSLPSLRHLKIHLPEAEEENLVATLSGLVTLNGIRLDGGEGGVASPGNAASSHRIGATPEPQSGQDLELPAAAEASMDPRIAAAAAREELRVRTLAETRGYAGPATGHGAGSGVPYKLEPWTSATSAEYRRLQQLCSKVAGPIANPGEYDDFHGTVVSHLRARLKADKDALRQQVHQFHAASLLLEYANEEVARASSKFGPELHAALRALADANSKALQTASNVMLALQDDRDRKVTAIQKDLTAELVLSEYTRVNAAAGETALVDFQEAMRDEERMVRRKGQVMDLPSLKQTMRLVVDSKIRHDRANVEARLPKETLEQHIYTYFTTRFSAREAIRSAVASVLSSIAAHAGGDLDVAVFGRMVHMDIDEGYWTVHHTLKSAIYDAVFSVLSGRGAERSASDIISGVLHERQSEEVLRALFPTEDVSWRLRGVVAVMRRLIIDRGDDPNFVTRPTIGYREFAFTVLKQELEQRLRDVKPVVTLFRELDQDRTGVIDGVQMRILIDKLAPGLGGDKETDLLTAVDPFGNNVILFSDVVSVMARFRRVWWMDELVANFQATAGSKALSTSDGHQRNAPLGRYLGASSPEEVDSVYDEDVRGKASGSIDYIPSVRTRPPPAREAASTLARRRK